MNAGDIHLSDEEVLAFVDGEVSVTRANQVRNHLAACWTCRSRLVELERTIGEFVRLHLDLEHSQVPPAAGPRALLKARLAEMRAESQGDGFDLRWSGRFWNRRLACASAAALLAIFWLGIWRYEPNSRSVPP